MGFVEMRKVSEHELDTCDSCNQQGLITSGHVIRNNENEPIIFFCFNCKQDLLKGVKK